MMTEHDMLQNTQHRVMTKKSKQAIYNVVNEFKQLVGCASVNCGDKATKHRLRHFLLAGRKTHGLMKYLFCRK